MCSEILSIYDTLSKMTDLVRTDCIINALGLNMLIL